MYFDRVQLIAKRVHVDDADGDGGGLSQNTTLLRDSESNIPTHSMQNSSYADGTAAGLVK